MARRAVAVSLFPIREQRNSLFLGHAELFLKMSVPAAGCASKGEQAQDVARSRTEVIARS